MRGFVASALVVAGLALAGCTGDPEPRFSDPTDEPSSSVPTSSAAAEPEPWEEKSKDGAVAFARHWVDVFNDAQTDGNTDALGRISATACKSCQGYISQLDDLYGGGGRLESEGWRLVKVGKPPGDAGDSLEVPMRINRPRQRVVTGGGKVARFPGAGTQTFIATVAWEDERWTMRALDVVA